MAAEDFVPDRIAREVAPGGVRPSASAVTFHGWFSAADDGKPLDGKLYRLFTTSAFDEWLDIPIADLLGRIPAIESTDGFSTVFVRREAAIVKTRIRTMKACEFAAEAMAMGSDPTLADYPAGTYPRH